VKIFSLCLLLLFNVTSGSAQQHYLDSLRNQLNLAKGEDTSRVLALSSVADYYGFVQFDSSLFYATQILDLSQKINYTHGKILGYRSTFFAYNVKGNYPRALEAALNLQKAGEQLPDHKRLEAGAWYFIGLLNREMADYPNAIVQLHKAISSQQQAGQPMHEIFFAFSQLGILYLQLDQLDSALLYAQKGYDLGLQSKALKKYFSLAIGALGNVEVALHNYTLAGELFRSGIKQSASYNNIYFEARNYNNLASVFDKTNNRDSCIYYATIALQLCREHNFGDYTIDASKMLTKQYELDNKPDSSLKYMKIMLAARDSVFSQSRVQQFQQYAFSEIQRLQAISTAKERYQSQVRIYILLAALGVFLLLAFLLYRNTIQKQKAKTKIEKAYLELKSTQAQLIQSEKMASLGELTAGIAHEIQNPLNFVNNFSELNKELLVEMNEEIEKGNYEEVKTIAKDVKDNEEKINHHGKRADAIVKGMLQHSRASTGQKELTDINALTDEYLRLSYHGMRAKDNSFNATMNTDFDASIGKINIVPQDIGRVLLNLYNNAFYAVTEKAKQQPNGYEPTISVTTKKLNNKVEITVKDNGNGIPQKVIDKIFQPFFTTKPTGVGTGLGLSLSYDIIKAHGGEIKVSTKEGEGSEFIIQLPI
jgi:two-component system, NtrC family, sensor kinase